VTQHFSYPSFLTRTGHHAGKRRRSEVTVVGRDPDILPPSQRRGLGGIHQRAESAGGTAEGTCEGLCCWRWG